MDTPEHVRESEMLHRVRRWRREAYEESRDLTAEERARRADDLCKRFGLKLRTAPKPSQQGSSQDSPDNKRKSA